MKIQSTNFKGLKILNGKIFFDSRGFFREMYQKRILNMHKPIFWCMSKSKQNVFRGLHLQTENMQEKLVSVVKGKVLDIVVDLRPKSKTFGKHFKIILSDKNALSVLIPIGFAHGFVGLDKENIVLYSNNNYRSQKSEIGLLWNDKRLKINWPKKKFIISKKDKSNITFSQYLKKFKINNGQKK